MILISLTLSWYFRLLGRTGSVLLISGFLIVAVILLALLFNDLIQTGNNVCKAWANIDVLFKKRFDLIPELVVIVKGYAG